jgi:adhesin/invasin
VDGLVNASVFPKPNLPVQVTIGGVNAQVAYFGEAPGLVSGVFQANVVVPAGITPGNAPVVVTVGTASSPAGVTIAVK